jgi:hypothetical protein
MSEFSESFHFAQSTRDEIAASLGKAGMKGVLFGPSETGWVTFVPLEGCAGHQFLSGPNTDFSNTLSRITGKTVLEWVYAEDHLWFALLAEGGKRVASYTGDWSEDEPAVESDGDSLNHFIRLPAEANAAEKIRASMPAQLSEADLMGGTPHAYRLAEALGLPKYQWLSSQYMTADMAGGELEDDDGMVI